MLQIYLLSGNVAADISGTITKYIRGINLICSEINGQRYYYLYNGHGDVVQIVDNNGSVVNNYKYDEWGNIVTQTEGINNPFKYCGEYYDKETGLYYLRARYYDPTIGRFINEDSFLGNDRDPLSLNLYTYCSSNPINFFDPSGHDAKDVNVDSGSGSHRELTEEEVAAFYNYIIENMYQDIIKEGYQRQAKVFDAQLVGLSIDIQSYAMEFQWYFYNATRGAASIDRINEVLEDSSQRTNG